jgi:hypothetical protein
MRVAPSDVAESNFTPCTVSPTPSMRGAPPSMRTTALFLNNPTTATAVA